MPQWNALLKALSVVLPAGAVGASVLLALASTDALAISNQSSRTPPSGDSVSTRLQEIRIGISDMTGSASDPAEGGAKAEPAWWGNGGWHNGWHNFWHNW
jgi:rSAM-associated Gly-rich repeat protein